jgi:hypothetical protein
VDDQEANEKTKDVGVAIAGAVRQRPMRHVRRERSGHGVRDAFAFASRHFGSVVRPPLLGRHSGSCASVGIGISCAFSIIETIV